MTELLLDAITILSDVEKTLSFYMIVYAEN